MVVSDMIIHLFLLVSWHALFGPTTLDRRIRQSCDVSVSICMGDKVGGLFKVK